MATVSIKTTAGSDFAQFIQGFEDNFDVITANATTLALRNKTTGERITVKGEFQFPSPGAVTGKATSVTFVGQPGDFVYATFTGLGVDGIDVAPFVEVDVDAVLGLLGSIRFIGNTGDDVGYGAIVDDDLAGGGGNDTLSAFDGDDIVEGGAGADEMHGGTGKDTLSYKDSDSKVTVSLKGAVSGGDAAGDTFDGFENVTGSAFNDKLIGINNANVLNGGDGNDLLRGSGGADSLIGGSGSDTADYTGSRAGVTIDLGVGTASGSHALGDTFSSIENVIGSKFGDSLTGSIAGNSLDGAAGNDRLDGGTGNDILTGGIGSDTFVLSNLAASADNIADFEIGLDKLEVNAATFGGGLDALTGLIGSQLEINGTGLATSNSTRFTLNSATGELHFDKNGAKDGGPGDRIVATLDGDLSLFSSNDFLIV